MELPVTNSFSLRSQKCVRQWGRAPPGICQCRVWITNRPWRWSLWFLCHAWRSRLGNLPVWKVKNKTRSSRDNYAVGGDFWKALKTFNAEKVHKWINPQPVHSDWSEDSREEEKIPRFPEILLFVLGHYLSKAIDCIFLSTCSRVLIKKLQFDVRWAKNRVIFIYKIRKNEKISCPIGDFLTPLRISRKNIKRQCCLNVFIPSTVRLTYLQSLPAIFSNVTAYLPVCSVVTEFKVRRVSPRLVSISALSSSLTSRPWKKSKTKYSKKLRKKKQVEKIKKLTA